MTSACSKVSQSTTAPENNGAIPGTLRYADLSEPVSLNPLLRLEAISTDMDM
ncbi:MAG: hypothetical protein JO219_01145, partial [Candidatus Eremiobacteraeota bacterium]|nr:hypothetical protein [Candidatus Eremiobacteraeota bacterium]